MDKQAGIADFLRSILQGVKQWGGGFADFSQGVKKFRGRQLLTGLNDMFVPGGNLGRGAGISDFAGRTIGQATPTGLLGGLTYAAGRGLSEKYSEAYVKGFTKQCEARGVDPRKILQ